MPQKDKQVICLFYILGKNQITKIRHLIFKRRENLNAPDTPNHTPS